MKVTFTLDDELADFLQREAASRHLALGAVLNERLTVAKPLDGRHRSIIVSDAATLHELEKLLGSGHILGEFDLLSKVRRLASIEFGAHRFELTAGQLEELKFRAGKTGRTVEQLVEDLYRRMSQDLFRTVA